MERLRVRTRSDPPVYRAAVAFGAGLDFPPYRFAAGTVAILGEDGVTIEVIYPHVVAMSEAGWDFAT